MQTVSQAWKDNQKQTLVGESDIEVSIKLTDPDAYEDASATDNGHVYYSNTNHTVSDGVKNIKPYATLERNLWLLDGSREIVPASNYGETGFVDDGISTSTGEFSPKPIVTINFSKVNTKLLQGITITWSNYLKEYAVEFTVKAYNGTTVVATKTITDNSSVKTTVMMDIINYNSITIEITKWSMGLRRARIDEIFIGVDVVFAKNDIFSYSCSYESDPISAELPKSEASFSLNNVDKVFNPYNVGGLSKYLIERQEISVKYGYKLGSSVEWVNGGKFYLSEWDAAQGGIGADFVARDLLEFMTNTYYKGLYNPNGTSLYDLAEDVLLDADLPVNADGSVKWVIDNGLKNIYTKAPLPIDSHANCLQLIANAGCCVLYQDRTGVLHLKQRLAISTDTDYDVSLFNSYSKSDLSLSKPLKQVEVPCYSYSVSTESSELYKGVMNINGTIDVLITYSGQASNVSATLSGGTLNSATYYTNSCVLNITANGDVTITVKGYNLESSSVQIVTSSSESGETITVDNPLITSQDRAVAIGSWVESYMKNRMTLSSNWRADPRLDALDVVDNENDYGVNKVLMTKVEYSYNGAFRGSGEGRVV